jgi:hypothetical protein
VDERPRRLRRELLPEPPRRNPVTVDVGRQERLVVLGEGGQDVVGRVDRRHGRRQALLDLPEHPRRIGAAPVGLVQEEDGRHLEPPQRPHQQRRLRLHALDRRDHEHCTIQHAEHALDLGNEVRVAGSVDQVDPHVPDLERDDRGLDRDPALLLERHRVGLRRTVVDAAEHADHAGLVEKPFGESCLTGVYMRQDPQVERSSKQGSYPPSRSQRPSRWT